LSESPVLPTTNERVSELFKRRRAALGNPSLRLFAYALNKRLPEKLRFGGRQALSNWLRGVGEYGPDKYKLFQICEATPDDSEERIFALDLLEVVSPELAERARKRLPMFDYTEQS